MFGSVKLDNTLLTCDQGNFNQITARQPELNPSHSGERHMHYHCATSTPLVSFGSSLTLFGSLYIVQHCRRSALFVYHCSDVVGCADGTAGKT